MRPFALDWTVHSNMKQNPQPAAEPAAKPRATNSTLAAAFDRMAQKSGFENWKQLDREQPLPTRSSSPAPASDPDAKPEPPRIAGKHAAAGGRGAGTAVADVSFAEFMKDTKPLPSASRKRG